MLKVVQGRCSPLLCWRERLSNRTSDGDRDGEQKAIKELPVDWSGNPFLMHVRTKCGAAQKNCLLGTREVTSHMHPVTRPPTDGFAFAAAVALPHANTSPDFGMASPLNT